ncbi:cysteine desulfurase family protein [Herbidospora sp. RD11066]
MTPSPARSEPPVIYLDNAATSPLHPRAAAEMRRGLDLFGNPSSRHSVGQTSHEALAAARAQVAVLLGCAPEEVVFTGGGSEAINLALCGTFAAAGFRGHLVTTGIEHSAVLESAGALRRRGVDVTVVPPLPSGHVDPDAVARELRPDTVLVSVMHANNETGAIQPVEEITRLVHAAGKAVHVDAVQTAGKLPVDRLDADLVSVSAHKFGGPKGVGALRLRAGHVLEPIVCGGGQEAGRRAGTENLVGILGMASAAAAALEHTGDPGYRARRWGMRLRLLDALAELGGVQVNASDPVMAETVSVFFAGVRADALADVLDMQGVCVSTGSACHSGDDSPSHVLTAMGIDRDRARGTVRISFGHTTTVEDIDTAARRIVTAVHRLREVSGARPFSTTGAAS